jgi:hypothetical protein
MNKNSIDRIEHIDRRIDQVLTALRDAEAPMGMERRILEAAQRRAAVPASNWHRLQARIQPMIMIWTVALASIVAVIASLTLIHRSTQFTPQSIAAAPQTSAPAVATETPPAATSIHLQKPHQRRIITANQVDPYELLAVNEMRAPSHPAPPMPPTEQEKLMLRIVHRNDPVELAELNPAMRAAQQDDEKKSFQKFFEPVASKTGDSE